MTGGRNHVWDLFIVVFKLVWISLFFLMCTNELCFTT